MRKDIGTIVENMFIFFLVIFGLFIVYQIILKMIGGSWDTEDVIISLLVFNIGGIFSIGLVLAKLRSYHNHLANQFRSLVDDFKGHIRK